MQTDTARHHLLLTAMLVSSLLSEKLPVVKSVSRRPQDVFTYVMVTDSNKDAPSSCMGERRGGNLAASFGRKAAKYQNSSNNRDTARGKQDSAPTSVSGL